MNAISSDNRKLGLFRSYFDREDLEFKIGVFLS